MLLIKNLKLPNNKVFNFELSHGEDHVIRGSNGLGKSLFLKSLAHLIPVTYEVFNYKNIPLNEWQPEVYRSEILYVHQSMPKEAMKTEDFLNLPLKFSIYKDYTFPIELKSYTDRWHITGKDIAHLSMGQRQLLTLLRAVSLKAEVLLLDEPFSHLDPQKTTEAEALIMDWKKRVNGTFLMVAHDEHQASRIKVPEINLNSLFV